MKIKILKIAVSIFLTMCLFCSCNNYKTVKSFKEKAVENGFNNLLAGGNISYCENTLYYYSNMYPKKAVMNAYKFTDNGKTDMLSDKTISLFYINGFYEYNNRIYSFLEDDDILSVYNNENGEFVKGDIDINRSNVYYLSDDIKIYYKSNKKLNVNYKGKDYVIKFNKGIYRFYPVDETIYIQSDEGGIYYYSLKTPNMEPEFIDELADDGNNNVFSVCGDYVYYDYYCDEDEDRIAPDGLYRFSLKDKTHHLVSDKEITCVNSWNNKFYFVADGILYLDNKEKPVKLTDLKTKRIYIFDNKWIYLDDLEGNVFRVDYKNDIVEKIDI